MDVEVICDGSRGDGTTCRKKLLDYANGIERGSAIIRKRCPRCAKMHVIVLTPLLATKGLRAADVL